MAIQGSLRDLRHAVRLLGRAPAFTIIAILTFAVGIGVNTAVFSVFSGVILRPLPYPDSDRIALIWTDNRSAGIPEDVGSYPSFLDWREQSQSFEHMGAFTEAEFTLTGDGDPERLPGARVTASFFDVMGIRPSLGTVFTAAHDTSGNDAVAVLSHGLWQRRFGGSPDVLGSTVTLSGRAVEVIGVMGPELQFPANAELWMPLPASQQLLEARDAFWLAVIGRLKPGVSPEQAQTEMDAITSRIGEQIEIQRGFGANVVPLHEQLVGDVQWSLIVLLGAVGFVLLIACANLGNLLLGRMAARRKEFAIRTALGAGRWRLVRQIFTEALVLATVGSGIGLALALVATRFFILLGGDSIPRQDAIAIDARVLLFTVFITVVAALLAALVPAFQAMRGTEAGQLKEGGREGSVGVSRGTRDLLVAAEVALAFVLLTGAGLLVKTLWTLQSFDRGFETDGVISMTLTISGAVAAEPADVRNFQARLLDRVRALPGVDGAALATGVLQPLLTRSTVFEIEGEPVPPPEERVEFPFEQVTPGFFELLGVEPLAGRTFNEGDHADAPRVAVINQRLANTVWPGRDPLGRRLRGNADAPWATVVGVIPDIRRGEVGRPIRGEVYFAATQVAPRGAHLLVRTTGDPADIVPAVRAEVRRLAPQLPLFDVQTLDEQLGETVAPERFRAILLAGFALIALLLAAIGIYGVTAHAVNARTQEIGVRLALGAGGSEVVTLLFRQHLFPAVVGMVIGIAGALALGRYLESLVFGVGVTDPLTFGVMAAALLGVASLACAIAARRAIRVDPLVALRAN